MKPDKHLLLLFAALILSAVSQHFYVGRYRREMRTDQTASRELAQKQAGAYLQQNLAETLPIHEEHDKDGPEDSQVSSHTHSAGKIHEHTEECAHDHEHEHHLTTDATGTVDTCSCRTCDGKHHEHGHENGHEHDHECDHKHATASETTQAVKSVALDVSDVPGNQLEIGRKATASMPFSLCTNPNCKSHGHAHIHDKHDEHAGHDHEKSHDAHEHAHVQDHTSQDPSVTPGFALLLRELGFAELAANLLWIQMDADSHRGLWHRVEVALELIPALDPTFIDAYLLRSFLLDEYMKKHDEALQILENAVKHVPNRIELWQQIGIFCLNHSGRHGPQRRLERALEAFNMMFRFYDPPPQTPRLIAVTLTAMERREEAIAILQKSADATDRPPDQKQIDREMIGRIRSGEKF